MVDGGASPSKEATARRGVLLPPLWAIHSLGFVSVCCGETVLVALYLRDVGQPFPGGVAPACVMAEHRWYLRLLFAATAVVACPCLFALDLALAQSITLPALGIVVSARPRTAWALRALALTSMLMSATTVATEGTVHMAFALAWVVIRIIIALVTMVGLLIAHLRALSRACRVDAMVCLPSATVGGLVLGILGLRLAVLGVLRRMDPVEELVIIPAYWLWLFLCIPPAGIARRRLRLPRCVLEAAAAEKPQEAPVPSV
mmetsp:Transcript_80653/g.250317  ORF Transcript_80653/g.250317 Transcript_80653/m.250317 type:complete len:259 (-) Transcript_80653:80-856(-)